MIYSVVIVNEKCVSCIRGYVNRFAII